MDSSTMQWVECSESGAELRARLRQRQPGNTGTGKVGHFFAVFRLETVKRRAIPCCAHVENSLPTPLAATKKAIDFDKLEVIDMADMSNRESASTDSSPLRNSAGTALLAPTFRNGCISELSSEALRGSGHDYTTAMKNYAAVYEEYQSYLMPVEQGLLHDYDLAVQPIPEFSHLGCLNADLLDSTVQGDVVSDDDIESCGYMAWVHH